MVRRRGNDRSMQILIPTSPWFQLWDRHLEQIRAVAPAAEITVKPMSGLTAADVDPAEIIFGFPGKELVESAKRLRWIQLASAGADRLINTRPDVILTNASGTFGIPIAEWVIGAMVTLSRHLHIYRDRQKQARWEGMPAAKEIYGSAVGILGLGDIGQEVAKRAKAMGARVIGSRRTAAPAPEGVDALLPIDDLLPQVDFLVMALPGTAETQRIMSAERLRLMKPGSFFLNVGRGTSVDEPALIEVLQSGHLAGAALDVTAVEPLPPDSPLWQMEQVLITPHCSGRSLEANADRRIDIFLDNLKRYMNGQPLRNVVDRAAGY